MSRAYQLAGAGAQTTEIVATTAGAAVSAAAEAGLIAASVAGPIGLAIAGVTIALMAIFSRKGPAQRIASTQIVNELEPQLQQNLAAYMAGPRTASNQAAALANFDAAWQYLASTQGCGNPDLGNPGKACIEDRAPAGQWDWFAMYRDPIANDPTVTDDPIANALSEIGAPAGWQSAIEENWLPLLLIAVALIL